MARRRLGERACMLSAGKHRGQSKPDRAMWRFAFLICREADATSRARNLT